MSESNYQAMTADEFHTALETAFWMGFKAARSITRRVYTLGETDHMEAVFMDFFLNEQAKTDILKGAKD